MLTLRFNHVVCCNFGYGVENLEFSVQSFYVTCSLFHSTSNKLQYTLSLIYDESLLYLAHLESIAWNLIL